MHFARNLLQRIPKEHHGMLTAALRSVFAQEDASEIESRWDGLPASLVERFPRATELRLDAKEDVLAFRHFPQPHRRKFWSINLLDRLNEEVKCRTRVVGIFPNDVVITRLVGAVLLEQDEHWQLVGRRLFSAETMAAIPALDILGRRPRCKSSSLKTRAPVPKMELHRKNNHSHYYREPQAKELTSHSSGFTVFMRAASAARV